MSPRQQHGQSQSQREGQHNQCPEAKTYPKGPAMSAPKPKPPAVDRKAGDRVLLASTEMGSVFYRLKPQPRKPDKQDRQDKTRQDKTTSWMLH